MTKDKAEDTGFVCTNYFRGRDGLGTCDTGCQWWQGSCPCAKGSKDWDGKEHYTERNPIGGSDEEGV